MESLSLEVSRKSVVVELSDMVFMVDLAVLD